MFPQITNLMELTGPCLSSVLMDAMASTQV